MTHVLNITYTLFQHRKIKNQMNRIQFTRKFQFLGNLTNPLQDFIGTHITQFPLLAKFNHPFHWSNFQIHLITFFKLQIPSPMIGIRFWPTIGHLKPVPFTVSLLQSLIYQLGTKKQWLTNLKPSYRGPIPLTIQVFIGSHGNG